MRQKGTRISVNKQKYLVYIWGEFTNLKIRMIPQFFVWKNSLFISAVQKLRHGMSCYLYHVTISAEKINKHLLGSEFIHICMAGAKAAKPMITVKKSLNP